MKYKGHNPRRDANELEIVEALEGVGASVLRLDDIDLLVGFRGDLFLLEVKTPKGKLNEKQIKFIREWQSSIYIVRSVDEALAAIGAIE